MMTPKCCLVACLLVVLQKVSSAPVVKFPFGKVKGINANAPSSGKPLYIYIGIPFAMPPVGDLRFEPPVRFSNPDSSKVISSKRFRAACAQNSTPFLNGSIAEDCLYLNVFVPADDDGILTNQEPKKVMVWIHGGGYTVGSATEYQPTRMVTDSDVIVVTVQYRLGAFGFLSSGDRVLPGNNGLHDQLQALQWVKDNIGKFGGDGNDITVFGESAGSSSVSILAISPLAKGLFTKVILQSGTVLAPWAIQKNPCITFYTVAKNLKCLPWIFVPFLKAFYHQRIINCIKSKSTHAILNALTPDVPIEYLDQLFELVQLAAYAPVAGDDVLPGDPVKLLSDKTYLTRVGAVDRSYILGANNNEGLIAVSLLSEQLGVDATIDVLTSKQALWLISRAAVSETISVPPTPHITSFVHFMYSYPREPDGKNPLQGILDLISDINFVVPTIDFARSMLRACPETPVYLYLFDYFPELKDPSLPLKGTNHAMEVLYEFDEGPPFADYLASYAIVYTPENAALPLIYRGFLTQFAINGNPNGMVAPSWPLYDLEEKYYMAINLNPKVRQSMFRRRVALWLEFFPNYVGAVFGAGFGNQAFLP